ncbi:MAG: hypothetical protein QG629_361 [Patescibacteria group bacterium]|nr:hypothetical protein [Candidatus Saccharibacteria bacterium]MDQ5963279.1 hypothetical protein [Patescibacteria group bacterium]
MKNAQIANPEVAKKYSNAALAIDEYMQRNGEAGLSEKGMRVITGAGRIATGAVVGLATIGALKMGLTTHELGSAEITPERGESITHVIKRGVTEAGVKGVDKGAVASEASNIANYSQGFINPEESVMITVTQNGFQKMVGSETVQVSSPELEQK